MLCILFIYHHFVFIVTPRDWQGVPIPIDNFNIRFRPINKLEEPNHQAVMNLVQENVKEKGEQYQGLLEEIRTRNDVTEDYLNSKYDIYIYIHCENHALTPVYQSTSGRFDTLVCRL